MKITDRYIIGSWEITKNTNHDTDFIGGKAYGLFTIPPQWIIPFIVFTKQFYDKWKLNKNIDDLFEYLNPIDLEIFEIFRTKHVSHNSKVIIRSNSPNEDLEARGTYNSIVAINSIEAIIKGIDSVFKDSVPDEMFVLIQECISPSLTGHMSNERRISAKSNRWLVEQQDSTSQDFIIAKNGKSEEALYARNDKGLFTALRKVASYLISLDQNDSRYHCEWIWNGYKVWIAQIDKSKRKISDKPASVLIEKKGVPVPTNNSFEILKNFSETNSETWKKLRSPLEFLKLGIPYSDVYLLKGDQWNSNDEDIRKKVSNDIESLCSLHPIIIRCDIAKTVEMDDLLLPTSGALKESTKVYSFFEEVNEYFDEIGLSNSDWTFLISFQYSVKASALIHSYPYSKRIRVDALWGYPDGLLYFPHETWFYYPETNDDKQIKNYKNLCLFPTNKGWEPYDIEEPYDWQSVLNKSEVQILSNWALGLANSLGKEVQLMAFTKLEGSKSIKGCLPWHFTNLPIPQYTNSLKVLPTLDQIIVLKNWEDLKKSQLNDSKKNLKGVLIMPSPEILRNDTFLREAATFAASKKMPLYFQGSLLGHAYYIMSKTGANVIPIAQDEPKDNAVSYNKLVRDKIPIIIQQAGGVAQIRKLDKTKAITLLSQKVVEEAFEVWNSKNANELLNEIADVIEVIEALIKSSDIKKEELEELKKSKIAKRGGFEELYFLEETAIRSLKSVDNKNGSLPLFLNDSNTKISKKDEDKKAINFISVDNTENRLHFSVPMIPQVDNSLNLKKLRDISGNFEIQIEYIGNRMDIKVNMIKKVQQLPKFGEEGHQLSLF